MGMGDRSSAHGRVLQNGTPIFPQAWAFFLGFQLTGDWFCSVSCAGLLSRPRYRQTTSPVSGASCGYSASNAWAKALGCITHAIYRIAPPSLGRRVLHQVRIVVTGLSVHVQRVVVRPVWPDALIFKNGNYSASQPRTRALQSRVNRASKLLLLLEKKWLSALPPGFDS